MADQQAPEQKQLRMVLTALRKGAGILLMSLVAIGVIFFFILAAVLAGLFG